LADLSRDKKGRMTMPEHIDTRTLAELESEIAASMRAYMKKLIRDHLNAQNQIGKDPGTKSGVDD
jgi:hypothetical protein